MTDQELYITTARKTRVQLTPRQLNKYLDQNIKREIEHKYAGKFFSYGYVRPGTIKVLPRTVGNKNGSSDFSGNMNYDVIFQCETFLPQVGEELIARVKSINRVGILAKSENNKVIVLLTKDNDIQTSPELFDEARLNNRVRIKILSHKIDSQAGSIFVVGDLLEVMTKIYQSYQMPSNNDVILTSLRGQIEFTNYLSNLYLNYENWLMMKNSKNQINSYFVPRFDDLDLKIVKSYFPNYKHSWPLTRSLVEEYELIHPPGIYNKGNGIAIPPFKAKVITRAYYKMWEILNRYKNLVSNLDSDQSLTVLALAEAPGSFIQAFSHYRKINYQSPPDTIFGYTLESDIPYLRWDWPVADKELKKLGQNLNLNYLNLSSKEAPIRVSIDLEKKFKDQPKVDLVIADGAVENEGATSDIEVINYPLFTGEIFTAMLNSKPGANFVLKTFDLLTKVNYQLIYLLTNYYHEVHITKPNFSRPASSEKYIICLGFRGFPEGEEEAITKMFIHILNELEKSEANQDDNYLNSLFNILINDSLTDEFRLKLEEINDDHTKLQSEFISKGIHLIHTNQLTDPKIIKQIKEEQIKIAIQWCKNHNMEYQTRIDLTDEKVLLMGEIVAQEMINFSLSKKMSKDKEKIFKHFQNNYSFMSFTHMEEFLKSLQAKTDNLFQDEDQLQLFQIKTNILSSGFDLNEKFNSKFFTAFEIINQFPELTKFSSLNIHVHHDYSGEVMRGINQYLKSQDIKFNWTTSASPFNKIDIEENLPSFYKKYQKNNKHWLFDNSIDFTSPDFINDAKLPKPAELIWMDEEFQNESEFLSFPSLYGQTLFALKNLQKNGHLILKQWTFFRQISRSMMALLMVLFKEVKLVKPLASPKHSSEVYLICLDFQADSLNAKLLKELLDFQIDLNLYLDNDNPDQPGGHLPNFMDVNLTPQIEDVFRFYIHYLVVLNLIPKIQIDLDIHHNSAYSLTNPQQTSLELLQGRREEIKDIEDESLRIKEEENIFRETQELFKDVKKKIATDFNYLVNLKAKWDKLNKMPKIKADQEL